MDLRFSGVATVYKESRVPPPPNALIYMYVCQPATHTRACTLYVCVPVDYLVVVERPDRDAATETRSNVTNDVDTLSVLFCNQ